MTKEKIVERIYEILKEKEASIDTSKNLMEWSELCYIQGFFKGMVRVCLGIKIGGKEC